jgi:putative NADPH-quinone reductase
MPLRKMCGLYSPALAWDPVERKTAMNVLIVYAHPEPRSINHALKEAAKRRFEAAGWNVEISDLYAQRFNPVASRHDFLKLASPEHFSLAHEQSHAQASRSYTADILEEQDKVARADLLVFQFPLWWYSVPAIVKGWAERVLSKGFAYGNNNMFEDGLLCGKRAMLSVTTGGTRDELDADRRYTGTVEEFLRPFSGGVLAFCGFEVLDPFITYAAASIGNDGRLAEIQRLAERIDTIVSQFGATSIRAANHETHQSEVVKSMSEPAA